ARPARHHDPRADRPDRQHGPAHAGGDRHHGRLDPRLARPRQLEAHPRRRERVLPEAPRALPGEERVLRLARRAAPGARRHRGPLLRERRRARAARHLLRVHPLSPDLRRHRSAGRVPGPPRRRGGGRGPGRAARCRRAHPRPGEGPARVHRPRPGDARRQQRKPAAPGDDRRAGRPQLEAQPVARRGGRRPGRTRERGNPHHPLARSGAVGWPPARSPGRREGEVVTLGELTQRLRRADFLDGLGIYVGAHEVALAHVVKRFFTVALRHARTYPLPPATHAAERRQALGQVVRVHLEALEDAFVRPRGIVLASTAIADYLAFCRGETAAPIGLLITSDEAIELALVKEGRLVASQVVPANRVATPADLSRSLARQLADGFLAPEAVQPYHWRLPNGAGPELPALGDGDLLALSAGRLEAPREFFEAREPGLLPAVGAALDAVREGTLPVNLLPAEGRRGAEEGLSLATVVLVAVLGVLLLVWGGSALVKDELNRRHVRDELARVERLVKEVTALQNESDELRRQLKILT